MNILICLKLTSQMQFSDTLAENAQRLSGGKYAINPADLYALELALRIKEQSRRAMVTVVTMAPDSAEYYLREALAMGADRVVLISDRRIAGSDTLATSTVLAAAIRRLPPQDLILCGNKSIDSETGHIGPQLSTLLALPLAVNVVSFSLAEDGVRVQCAGDSGQAVYAGTLPCILTICNGWEMVRQPTILGLRRSRSAPLLRFDLDYLGLDAGQVGLVGSPTQTLRVEALSFRTPNGRRVSGAEAGAAELFSLITGKGGAS